MSKTGKPTASLFWKGIYGRQNTENHSDSHCRSDSWDACGSAVSDAAEKYRIYTDSVIWNVTVAVFLTKCLRILPEKWFYPIATAWTMSVTSLFACSGYVLFVTGNTGHGIMGNMMNAVLFINLTMLVSTGISTAWKLHHRGK